MGKITRGSISFQILENGHEIMLVKNVLSLKTKSINRRNIPVPIERDIELKKLILNYIGDKGDDFILFPYSRITAFRRVRKYTGYFPHYFRHIRNTILTQDYGLNEWQLKLWNGWTSSTSASYYVQLNWQDVANALFKT